MKRGIPPLGASKWRWAAWWVDLIVTYATYIAVAYVAVHFIEKLW